MTTIPYSVRLESPSDRNFRIRTVGASSVDEARKIAERLEGNRAQYSLLDRAPVKSVQTRRRGPERVDAQVNLSVFADSGLGGRDLLDFVERDHSVDADGKTYGPRIHLRNHLQAHYQAEPYRIASVEPAIPSVSQIIDALRVLQGDPKQWDATLKAMREGGIDMAAVTGALFGVPWQKQIDGSSVTVWSSATIQTSLHTAYTLDNDTHDFFNDVSATEITGTGYTANGVTLASKTSTYDTATDQIRLDAADVSWTTSTLSATDAIVWNNTAGASSTDPVLGALDFGATVTTTAGTFLITWDATGIIVYDVT
jgi:hypothetical protein